MTIAIEKRLRRTRVTPEPLAFLKRVRSHAPSYGSVAAVLWNRPLSLPPNAATATMMAIAPVSSPSGRFDAKRLASLLTAHHHGGVYGQRRLYPDDKGNRSEKAIGSLQSDSGRVARRGGRQSRARLWSRHKREFRYGPVGTGNVIDGQIPGGIAGSMGDREIIVEVEAKVDDTHEQDDQQREDQGELDRRRAPLSA